jgi:hypothetical protein
VSNPRAFSSLQQRAGNPTGGESRTLPGSRRPRGGRRPSRDCVPACSLRQAGLRCAPPGRNVEPQIRAGRGELERMSVLATTRAHSIPAKNDSSDAHKMSGFEGGCTSPKRCVPALRKRWTQRTSARPGCRAGRRVSRSGLAGVASLRQLGCCAWRAEHVHGASHAKRETSARPCWPRGHPTHAARPEAALETSSTLNSSSTNRIRRLMRPPLRVRRQSAA